MTSITADHRGDHHHGQDHHGRPVNPHHDGREHQGQLDIEQDLPGAGPQGLGGLALIALHHRHREGTKFLVADEFSQQPLGLFTAGEPILDVAGEDMAKGQSSRPAASQ